MMCCGNERCTSFRGDDGAMDTAVVVAIDVVALKRSTRVPCCVFILLYTLLCCAIFRRAFWVAQVWSSRLCCCCCSVSLQSSSLVRGT